MKRSMKALQSLVKAKKQALKQADPRSRDRLRQRVKVLEVVAVLKSPGRSYKKISLPKMPWDEGSGG